MDAFWRHGYEATSLADLCTCTGLHKGSLYQSFGDKHELFMKALRHYGEREFHEVAAVAFQSESPLENLKAAVSKICESAGEQKGCFMTNSVVELAPHDPEVRALLAAESSRRIRAITDMIAKAQEAGEITVQRDPQNLARQLMVTLAGAATMVKGFLSKDEMAEVVGDVIASWT